MSYALGTATGRIEIEYDGTGVKQAENSIDGLKGNSQKALKGLNDLGNTAGVAGAVIAAGFAVGVNAAANFEERVSAISAVSGATGAELDGLRQKALDLGRDTKYSASEAASAIEELVKAGLSVDEVLNGAADATVALAAAGEVALPEAATIAANAMNQFNLAAEDMVNVTDIIAGAANSSAIDVSDLGQSLQQVGAVANLAGLNFEDTATAIALMGDAGIKGSDAGTSLKSMLMRLQPTTEKTRDLFQELGLLTYDLSDANKTLAKVTGQDAQKSIEGVQGALAEYVESINGGTIGTVKNAKAVDGLLSKYGGLNNQFYTAKGNTKGLAQISGQLAGALKGMTKEQKQAALTTLFGSDAIRAAAIMANNGAKGFNNMAKSMNKTSAADVAATRMDNFKGSLEEMKGSLETAGIAVGTVLLPPLRKIVDAVADATNWFLNLSDSQQKMIIMAIGIVGALLLVFAAIAKLIIFANSLATAFAALRAVAVPAWLATLGPILLVVAAVALVIAIIVLLWKKSETFRDIVIGAWTAIKDSAVVMWTAITDFIQAAWDKATEIVQAGLAIIQTVIQTVLGVIVGIWKMYWGLFGPLIKAQFNLVVAIIRLVWTIIKGIFLLSLRLLINIVRGAWNQIKSATSMVWNAIKAVLSAVWGVIGGTVMAGVNRVKSLVSTAWNAVKTVTSTVWNALKGIVSTAISAVVDLAAGIKDKVLGAIGDAGSWLYEKGREIIQGLIDGITDMIGKVTGAIDAVTSRIADALPGSPVKEGPLKVLNRGYAGKQIVQMIVDGIDSKTRPLRDTVDSALTVTPDVDLRRLAGIAPSAGRPRAASASPSFPSGLRIAGTLSIDENGVAFISGIAEDVYDNFNDDNNRRNR